MLRRLILGVSFAICRFLRSSNHLRFLSGLVDGVFRSIVGLHSGICALLSFWGSSSWSGMHRFILLDLFLLGVILIALGSLSGRSNNHSSSLGLGFRFFSRGSRFLSRLVNCILRGVIRLHSGIGRFFLSFRSQRQVLGGQLFLL